jgi:hypothetical protein
MISRACFQAKVLRPFRIKTPAHAKSSSHIPKCEKAREMAAEQTEKLDMLRLEFQNHARKPLDKQQTV